MSIGLNKEPNFESGLHKAVIYDIFIFNGIMSKSSGGAFL